MDPLLIQGDVMPVEARRPAPPPSAISEPSVDEIESSPPEVAKATIALDAGPDVPERLGSEGSRRKGARSRLHESSLRALGLIDARAPEVRRMSDAAVMSPESCALSPGIVATSVLAASQLDPIRVPSSAGPDVRAGPASVQYVVCHDGGCGSYARYCGSL